ERFVPGGPELKRAAGNLHVSRQRSSTRPILYLIHTQPWCSVPVRLPGIGERFRVHVFVEDRQEDKVGLFTAWRHASQPIQHPVAHFVQVAERLLPAWQS